MNVITSSTVTFVHVSEKPEVNLCPGYTHMRALMAIKDFLNGICFCVKLLKSDIQ